MDQFYISVYESVIYRWIVLKEEIFHQKGIHFHIDENDSQKLIFEIDNLVGHIYFWRMHHIIEETIVNQDNEIIFYLHFRVMNLANTRKFIIDFLKQLLMNQKPKRIGMSCSCGITSSVFVESIQQLSSLMHLPYQFDVIPLHSIQEKYQDYDMIILAPQTSYLEPRVKAMCRKDCYVYSMDASVFATSNYQKALMIIQGILG